MSEMTDLIAQTDVCQFCGRDGRWIGRDGHAPSCSQKNYHPLHAALIAEDEKNRAKPRLTTDSDKRKEVPLATGCFDYFPDALAAVAGLSYGGNSKHNPGQPLHWARSKSTDEADCLLRHFMERGTVDTDGIRHSVKVAWRALALLQKELEAELGLPISRGSRP